MRKFLSLQTLLALALLLVVLTGCGQANVTVIPNATSTLNSDIGAQNTADTSVMMTKTAFSGGPTMAAGATITQPAAAGTMAASGTTGMSATMTNDTPVAGGSPTK